MKTQIHAVYARYQRLVVSFMPSSIYPQGKTPQYPSGRRSLGSQRQFKGNGIQSVAIFSKHENHLKEKFTKIGPNVYKNSFNASVHKAYHYTRNLTL
jgi:hypothetical protein